MNHLAKAAQLAQGKTPDYCRSTHGSVNEHGNCTVCLKPWRPFADLYPALAYEPPAPDPDPEHWYGYHYSPDFGGHLEGQDL